MQIATIMYENRKDLANTETGDGWKYHGRGYFQYTGRYNYSTYGEKFGVDLKNNPDLAAEPEMAAKLAIAYWKEKVPESARLDARAAGEAINGGPNGARDRVVASRQWKTTITPELVRDIETGTLTLSQLATRDVEDLTIGRIQKNLNGLGIADARGQELVVDGIRGGPGSRTNEAIAAFRMQTSLQGQLTKEQTPAELLAATETVLDARQPMRGFTRTLEETSTLVPGPKAESAPPMVNRMPDFLLPGTAPDSTASTPIARSLVNPTTLPHPSSASLQSGDRGPAVQTLQEHLHTLGARDAQGRSLEPDGEFGHRTRQAVEQFQLWTGLEPTGIADPETLRTLQNHAQSAARRQQGFALGGHPTENLQPSTQNLADAAIPSPRETLDTAAPSTLAGSAAPGKPIQPMTQPETPSPLRPFNDIRHPQHALYAELKSCLPDYVSEARLAQFTTAAHVAGIKPGQLESIHIDAERAALTSRPGWTQAVVDMSANSPPLQESLERAQTFDLEQTRQAGQQANRPLPEQVHVPVMEH